MNKSRIVSIVVVLLRIIVGAVFILAGWAKLVDPWGGVYKVEEYIQAMGFTFNRPECLIATCALSTTEFTLGVLMLTGCLRRLATYAVALFMCAMTPLTLWIWLKDPVPDCGCFGDALVISNGVTFVKNIILLILALALLRYNKRVRAFIAPALQWLVIAACLIYAVILQSIGYLYQPIVDFRPFRIGTTLVDDADDTAFYIYRKDGKEAKFDAYDLPSGEDWTFVRIESNTNSQKNFAATNAVGENVTDSIVSLSENPGGLLMLVVSEPRRHGISRTHMANILSRYQQQAEGHFVAIVATDSIPQWRKAVSADYNVYSADDTQLKALARGSAAMVFVKNDTIKWKLNINALPPDIINFDNVKSGRENNDKIKNISPIEEYGINTKLGILLLGFLFILCLISIRKNNGVMDKTNDRQKAEPKTTPSFTNVYTDTKNGQ